MIGGGLLLGIAGIAAFSAIFYCRQNFAGQVGGPMSVEKILWLNYVLTAWVIVPAALVLHPDLHRDVRLVLAGLLISMVVRGLVELPLIYVTFGWSPIYGIAHDLATIGLIEVLRRRPDTVLAGMTNDFDAAVLAYTQVVQATFMAEIVFAALFYRMRVHQDAVYFAAPTAAFRHINRLTRLVDLVVYTQLGWFLWTWRERLFGFAGRVSW